MAKELGRPLRKTQKGKTQKDISLKSDRKGKAGRIRLERANH